MRGVLLTVLLFFRVVAGTRADESVLGWDYLDPQRTPIEFSNRQGRFCCFLNEQCSKQYAAPSGKILCVDNFFMIHLAVPSIWIDALDGSDPTKNYDANPVILISPVQPLSEISHRLNETARALMYVMGVQVARLHNIAKKLGEPQRGLVERMERAVGNIETRQKPNMSRGVHRRRGTSVAVSADENGASASAAASRRSASDPPPSERSAAAAAASDGGNNTKPSPPMKTFPTTTEAPPLKQKESSMNKGPKVAGSEGGANQNSAAPKTVQLPKKKSSAASAAATHKKFKKRPMKQFPSINMKKQTVPPPVAPQKAKKSVSSPVTTLNQKNVAPIQKVNKGTSASAAAADMEINGRPQKTVPKQKDTKPTSSPLVPPQNTAYRAPEKQQPVRKKQQSSSGAAAQNAQEPSMVPMRRPIEWKPNEANNGGSVSSPAASTPDPKRQKNRVPGPAVAKPSHGETSVAVSAGNGASVAVSAFRRSHSPLNSRHKTKQGSRKGRNKKKQKGRKGRKGKGKKNKKKQRNKRGEKKRNVWGNRRSIKGTPPRPRRQGKKKKPHSGATSVSVSASKGSASVSAAASRRHYRQLNRKTKKKNQRPKKTAPPKPKRLAKHTKPPQKNIERKEKGASTKNSTPGSSASRRNHHRRLQPHRRSASVSVAASEGSASVSVAASGKRRRRRRFQPHRRSASASAAASEGSAAASAAASGKHRRRRYRPMKTDPPTIDS